MFVSSMWTTIRWWRSTITLTVRSVIRTWSNAHINSRSWKSNRNLASDKETKQKLFYSACERVSSQNNRFEDDDYRLQQNSELLSPWKIERKFDFLFIEFNEKRFSVLLEWRFQHHQNKWSQSRETCSFFCQSRFERLWVCRIFETNLVTRNKSKIKTHFLRASFFVTFEITITRVLWETKNAEHCTRNRIFSMNIVIRTSSSTWTSWRSSWTMIRRRSWTWRKISFIFPSMRDQSIYSRLGEGDRLFLDLDLDECERRRDRRFSRSFECLKFEEKKERNCSIFVFRFRKLTSRSLIIQQQRTMTRNGMNNRQVNK